MLRGVTSRGLGKNQRRRARAVSRVPHGVLRTPQAFSFVPVLAADVPIKKAAGRHRALRPPADKA
jgi:hypothetical protein